MDGRISIGIVLVVMETFPRDPPTVATDPSTGRVSMVNVFGRDALGGKVSITKLLGDRLLIGECLLVGYISIATLLGDTVAAG